MRKGKLDIGVTNVPQSMNPDLLLGSCHVLLCKGSSRVVSPVSLEELAKQN